MSAPRAHSADDLRALCRRIDGRSYGAWKALRDGPGVYDLDGVVLIVDHVQGDPFAAPSRLRLRLPSGIPAGLRRDAAGRLACEDLLLRALGDAVDEASGRRGSGRSGQVGCYRPGPEILRRSAVVLEPDGTAELRISAGLPARGRRVLGREGHELLARALPAAARRTVAAVAAGERLAAHVHSVRSQQHLRDQLAARGLVAFLADGSRLPRESGVSQAPLAEAVPLVAPDGLAVTLDGLDGPVRGLGIPRGVTLITGGGFHGKSTLLQAIQRGHLDHVPGDGRERVVTVADAVKVRAEDGRSIAGVDIRAFLSDLPAPGGRTRSTRAFRTADASGSTSQAAAVVEAVEAGSTCLLLDEDTSATNLLVRDERMAALIPGDREPITPLVRRVRGLVDEWGVSVVMVVGGVGAFLDVADVVVGLERFEVVDLTARARALARPVEGPPAPLPALEPRVVVLDSLRPDRERVRSRRADRVEVGREEIDLSGVEQVLDAAHARSLGQALRLLREVAAAEAEPLPVLLDRVDAVLQAEGPDALSPWDTPTGDLLALRRTEIAAAVDRLRGLQVLEIGVQKIEVSDGDR